METGNLVSTIAKAVTPKLSTVPVSKNGFIAEAKVQLQPVGQSLPEVRKESSTSVAQQIEEKVQDLNSFVQNIQRGIQFSVHESTGQSIITVSDKETGDVIRTFPSEEVLAVAAYLAENKVQLEDATRGLLVNDSA